MFVFKLLWCFVFFQIVLSDLQIVPCLVTDNQCISRTTQVFLDSTSGGIPQYDIRQLDPITIPSLVVTPKGTGSTFHFTNIVVRGFKDQKISDFKLDKNSKEVNLKTKVDLVLNGKILVELHKPSKSYSGSVVAEATVEGHAKYNYKFVKDEKDVEHYEVGPEINSCEVLGDPKFTLNPELLSKLDADVDIEAEKVKFKDTPLKVRQQIICEVVKTVYVTAIHNIRAAARVLPKSAFFTDV